VNLHRDAKVALREGHDRGAEPNGDCGGAFKQRIFQFRAFDADARPHTFPHLLQIDAAEHSASRIAKLPMV
jgi:hypothetical protein